MHTRFGVGLCTVLMIFGLCGHPCDASAQSAELCRMARYKASSRYLACQEIALAREVNPSTLVIGGLSEAYQRMAARCRLKYATAWTRIQASLSGAVLCSGPRFVDTGLGTTRDRLTGLEWEQKTDDGTVHDKDDVYTWSATGSASDGTVFTTFLAALNGAACFAGRCDWRLPTMAELQTILDASAPCTTCVDPAFSPFAAYPHWTSTEDADLNDSVREVSFNMGFLNNGVKSGSVAVRAVRGGL